MILSNKKKIVLGLSGGVDSAVCAFLLKQQGYNVICLFMKNWDTVANNDILGHYNKQIDGCESNKDFLDAKKVADYLNLEFHYIDFVKEYWDNVFTYFIEEYKKSRTPNPDILCNKYIKFESFVKYAIKKFNPDFIAMGHYAQTLKNDNGTFLVKSKDQNKDQTYFLSWLNENQISNVLFPIGNLEKKEVREIAKNNNLPIWDKKDSTGICFIGERKFNQFLSNYIPNIPGDIIDIKSNKIIGKHNGTMYYTLGQNKNLGLQGKENKYFICKKDIENKILYVATNEHKKEYLLSNVCKVFKMNFINKSYEKDIINILNLQVRFRHRQELVKILKIEILQNNILQIYYEDTLMVTPGQFAVIYDGIICVGGGIIDSIEKRK